MHLRFIGVTAAFAAMIAIAACSNDTTAPSESVAGIYQLTSINGAPIPFAYPPDSFASGTDTTVHISIVGPERIRLFANGTAVDTLRWTDEWTSKAAPWSSYAEHRWSTLMGSWRESGGEVTILVDSGFTSSDYPYTSTDTVVFAKPDTMHFETGTQSLLSNQHYQSKSLGAPRPPSPYNWVYKWQP